MSLTNRSLPCVAARDLFHHSRLAIPRRSLPLPRCYFEIKFHTRKFRRVARNGGERVDARFSTRSFLSRSRFTVAPLSLSPLLFLFLHGSTRAPPCSIFLEFPRRAESRFARSSSLVNASRRTYVRTYVLRSAGVCVARSGDRACEVSGGGIRGSA